MIVHRLNESYSAIEADAQKIKTLFEYLKVERPGAYFDPAVKRGFKSPNEYFGSVQNKMLVVMNGHLQLLKQFGVEAEVIKSDYSSSQIDDFVNHIKHILPFQPYDFQEQAFKESILNVKQINKMCTGSGKSMTISLIAEFMRRQGKKGLLLVPNINLLTQFKSDIKSYNLDELHDDTHTIGGGNSDKHFNCTLTISTWQSMQNWKDELYELDYVITDECLHPETLIKTKNGEKKISTLKKDDIVLTYNEETKIYEYKPIVKVHKNLNISRKEKMFKLKLENGKILKITGNHKVLTQNGWKRVDNLTITDEILDLNDYNGMKQFKVKK